MNRVSRPLLGVLVATVAFFALWVVALKPTSSSTGANAGLGRYQSAIDAAKASAAAQNRAAAAANGTGSAATTQPAATKAAHPTAPKVTKPAAAVSKPAVVAAKHAAAARHAAPARAATPTQRLNVVDRALSRHKVLALLFYNPAGADDRAVRRELATIPDRRGRVVKLAIPVSEIGSYPVVTDQVLIESSPTLVVIDSSRQAFTLVGFASAFEISHRLGDALNMR